MSDRVFEKCINVLLKGFYLVPPDSIESKSKFNKLLYIVTEYMNGVHHG